MIVEDFVMLGKTVPEPTADGRVFVCSAGFSPELRSLIRVYPLARRDCPPRWSVSTVRLQRKTGQFGEQTDSRRESWQIAADRRPDTHDRINTAFTPVGTLPAGRRCGLLADTVVESIAVANTRRLSLAIVHPAGEPEVWCEHDPDSPASPQLRLLDGMSDPARRFAWIPRIRFRDEDGVHDLMVRDWGAFEFLRKGHDRHDLGRALHADADCSLLVGNFNRHRTAWCVISVLRGLRSAPALFTNTEMEVAA